MNNDISLCYFIVFHIIPYYFITFHSYITIQGNKKSYILKCITKNKNLFLFAHGMQSYMHPHTNKILINEYNIIQSNIHTHIHASAYHNFHTYTNSFSIMIIYIISDIFSIIQALLHIIISWSRPRAAALCPPAVAFGAAALAHLHRHPRILALTHAPKLAVYLLFDRSSRKLAFFRAE